MPIPNSTYRLHAMITAPAIDTDLLWGLSTFFSGLALLYLVSIFFFRNRISSKSSRTKLRKKELSPMISEFLFYEDDADKDEKSHYIRLKIEIRDLLKDDFNRKVLSDILLDLRKDVSGDTQRRLFKLYKDLDLAKDSFQKLKSWRWEVISKGILELTRMQVEEAYGFIVKFVNDRRVTIRKQAEIAIITLKPEGINYFLDTTKYKISEWQQLKLLDVLRNKDDFEPPRFKAWLTSTNKHVVLFALRLIKFYHQNDANASLIELVKHKDRQVRQQAVDCIKIFRVAAALPILKGIFHKCSVDIKIAILGAIAELGTVRDVEFLETVSKNEGNFSVKSKAMAAINTITPESIMPTENIEYVSAYRRPENGEEPDYEIKTTVPTSDIGKAEGTSIETEKEPSEQAREGPDDTAGSHPMTAGEPPEPKTLEYPKYKFFEKYRPMAHPKKSEKALREIAIEFEQILPAPSDEVQDTNIRDFDVSDIHFLPIVVDNGDVTADYDETRMEDLSDIKIENNETSQVPMDEEDEARTADVKNIEVLCEEISPDFMDQELETLVTEIKELLFLPIVTDEEPDIAADQENISATDGAPTIETDKVITTTADKRNTLTVDKEDTTAIYKEPDTDNKDPNIPKDGASETLNDIEGYSLSDFEVSFTEKNAEAPFDETESDSGETESDSGETESDSGETESDSGETESDSIGPRTISSETDFISDKDHVVDFDLEDEPIINLKHRQIEDVMSWLMADNELREIECNYQIVPYLPDAEIADGLIPEPVYYDEHEAYMMGLLDDLEELGDHREIPLLEELRAEESKTFIKERIEGMIKKFKRPMNSNQTTLSNTASEAMELPVFSVFADLFKNIDTESKLILLNEVVAVGDEKEIEFLDGLLKDPEPKIRGKAQIVLKQLIAKLSYENPSATYSKGISDIVAEQIKDDETLGQQLYDSLLSEMNIVPAVKTNPETTPEVNRALATELEGAPSKNPEIFDIDFEFSEALGHRHGQKIRDLPVVATEVPPNDSGGSFFSQLRNFTKLFF